MINICLRLIKVVLERMMCNECCLCSFFCLTTNDNDIVIYLRNFLEVLKLQTTKLSVTFLNKKRGLEFNLFLVFTVL